MLGKKSYKPHRKYDAEFKRDVLKMIANGRLVREVAQSLEINENVIHRWKSQANESSVLAQSPSTASLAAIPAVPGAEHERVKARLREVEQERDILKKALGIFSRGN
jgi:transposase